MSHKKGIKYFFSNSDEAELKNWKKGSYLCSEGGELSSLHYLLSGRFRVFRSLSNGREMMYRIYLPGSVIGDIEFFTGGDSASCSVQCIEPAATLSLKMEKLRSKPETAPQFIFELGKGIARKLHENSVSEALNALYPLEVRLAHYFLTFTDPGLQAQTLGQLAGWMGCSYRHLTRSLSGLASRGAIQKQSSGYRSGNLELLESIAEPLLNEEFGRTLFEPGDTI